MSSVELLNKIRIIEEDAQKRIQTAKVDGEERLKKTRKEAQEKIERTRKEAQEYQKKLADDILTSTKEETSKINLENQKQISELKSKISASKDKAVEKFVSLITTVE